MKRMMKHWMFAAILLCGFVTLTSCSVDDNPVGMSHTVTNNEQTEPTADQMGVSVTADLPTAALSQFDANSTAAALMRRLPKKTSSIDLDTRVVILKGSDFENGSPLTEQQMDEVAMVYLNWGYVAIERPTEKQLNNFWEAFGTSLAEMQEWLLAESFDMDEEEAAAAAKSNTMADRMKTRMNNVLSIARRAAEGDDDENEVVAEMLIYTPDEYFYQEPFDTEEEAIVQSQDGDGELSEPVTMTFQKERNDYYNGILADGVAQWLNDAEKRQDEKWSNAETPASTQRRASSTDAINEMISASETFTFTGDIYSRDEKNKMRHEFRRVMMTVRTWGVHNFSTNKDYYYVKQMASLNMSKSDFYGQLFFPTEDENTWFEATGYGQNNYWNNWYGSFLSEFKTSMQLRGTGKVLLEAATPETENGATTTSINIGESASQTTTVGITASFTGGTSGGKPLATGTIGGSWTEGTTTGTSFSMGSSRVYKDIRPIKNRENQKVTWTYKANLPKFRIESRDKNYFYYMHDTAGDILTNTADLTSEACWSVANPEGRFTLEVTSYPQTAALMYHYDKDKDKVSKMGHYEYTNATTYNQFSHELLQPNRSLQKWTMSIMVDEVEGYKLPGQGAALEKRIMEKYPQHFRQEFTLADKEKSSLEAAASYIRYSKNLFAEQYEILQDMAKDQGIKKFTIVWRRQGSTAKENFTVAVGDNTNKLVADGGTDDGKDIIDHLFDGNLKTRWTATNEQKTSNGNNNGSFWYVEFHAPAPVSPESYTIIADKNVAKGCNPAWWILYGKKEKSDKWVELVNNDDRYRCGSQPWDNCTTKPKKFDKRPEDMQYFRLEIYRSWMPKMQLSEFYFNYPTEE